MRPSKISDDKLLDRLTGVFRVHGFEGASLTRLVKATGLRRASLYHRFPGGKDEMAQAVVGWVNHWFVEHVFTPLSGPGSAEERVRNMAKALSKFYARGRKPCLLNTLSLGGNDNEIGRHLRASFEAWLENMAAIARETGIQPKEARRRAEEALIGIQGALVLARIAGDHAPFKRVLDRLPSLLTDGEKP